MDHRQGEVHRQLGDLGADLLIEEVGRQDPDLLALGIGQAEHRSLRSQQRDATDGHHLQHLELRLRVAERVRDRHQAGHPLRVRGAQRGCLTLIGHVEIRADDPPDLAGLVDQRVASGVDPAHRPRWPDHPELDVHGAGGVYRLGERELHSRQVIGVDGLLDVDDRSGRLLGSQAEHGQAVVVPHQATGGDVPVPQAQLCSLQCQPEPGLNQLLSLRGHGADVRVRASGHRDITTEVWAGHSGPGSTSTRHRRRAPGTGECCHHTRRAL
nr:hypothetical protein [Modestobacter sp. DSM 44400]